MINLINWVDPLDRDDDNEKPQAYEDHESTELD